MSDFTIGRFVKAVTEALGEISHTTFLEECLEACEISPKKLNRPLTFPVLVQLMLSSSILSVDEEVEGDESLVKDVNRLTELLARKNNVQLAFMIGIGLDTANLKPRNQELQELLESQVARSHLAAIIVTKAANLIHQIAPGGTVCLDPKVAELEILKGIRKLMEPPPDESQALAC